jgi:glycosyltransferase involved in cell wall biosynthesis
VGQGAIDPPVVSVLMPTRDRAALIEESVHSVLRQTFDALELIVIDNESTDETAALLAAIDDPRLRVIRSDAAGIGALLNVGLRIARGRFVARNDSDDVWLPELLSTLIPALESSDALGFAYGIAQNIDESGALTGGVRGGALADPADPLRSLIWTDYTCVITTVYRMSCVRAVGGWDEEVGTSEDWDLAVRVARDHRVVFIDRPLARIRLHPGNTTNRNTPGFEQRLVQRRRVLDKLFASPLPPHIVAMRPAVYRNVYIGTAIQLWQAGQRARGLEEFGKAMSVGGWFAGATRIATVVLPLLMPARLRDLVARANPVFQRLRSRRFDRFSRNALTARTRNAAPRDAEPAARVTIVVVPRERFSFARTSLESLLANTHTPFELIYVDGGSPRHIRRFVELKSEEYGFKLIRENRYLIPNEARNIGARHVRTPYAVFIDNDTLVRPGWLDRLVECADETGAWVCGPLVLFGQPGSEIIHVAGGTLEIRECDGRREFRDSHRFEGIPAADVAGAMLRASTDLIEFHCMLVRMEAFAKLGPFDEELLGLYEHEDFCLAVADAGGPIAFEPASVVSYVPPQSLRWSDVRYFMTRWSDAWNRASYAQFCDKWRLDADPEASSTLRYAAFRRREFLRGPRRFFHATLGTRTARLAKRALRALERLVGRATVRW